MEKKRIVRGEVVLPDVGTPKGTSADVIVQVEDISRADAPSIIVGEQRQAGVTLHGGDVIPFTVEVPLDSIDDRRIYSVRAHVDLSGSGNVKQGDLVSTQTYPVLTRGHGTETRVTVKRV